MGYLEVARNGGPYHIRGTTEIDLQDGSLADVLRCIRFSVIQVLMQARPDLFWFHAGAASLGGHVMLLPGAPGRGKSTLVAGLCARGWTYLSDEVVPLNPTSSRVVPFPLTPLRREFPGQEMPAEWLRAPNKVAVPITREASVNSPRRSAPSSSRASVPVFGPSYPPALRSKPRWGFFSTAVTSPVTARARCATPVIWSGECLPFTSRSAMEISRPNSWSGRV